MPFVGARGSRDGPIDITVATVGGFDLSAVTSSDLVVQDQSGAVLPASRWTWSISGASASSVHLIHAFSEDGLDATTAGQYTVSGFVVTPSASRRISPVRIQFERYP